MSEEEKIEQAISNLTRGNDIESAIYILERCALHGLIIYGDRVNIYKVAVRQILKFLDEYKNKGYLDVVREKVRANELVEKLQKENEYRKEVLINMLKENEQISFDIDDKIKIIEKLQKENQELKEKYKNINWYFENQKDNFVHKDKIREIIYPTPDNMIPLEVQTSDMYMKLKDLVEGNE